MEQEPSFDQPSSPKKTVTNVPVRVVAHDKLSPFVVELHPKPLSEFTPPPSPEINLKEDAPSAFVFEPVVDAQAQALNDLLLDTSLLAAQCREDGIVFDMTTVVGETAMDSRLRGNDAFVTSDRVHETVMGPSLRWGDAEELEDEVPAVIAALVDLPEPEPEEAPVAESELVTWDTVAARFSTPFVWSWKHHVLRPVGAFLLVAMALILPFRFASLYEETKLTRSDVLASGESGLRSLATAASFAKALNPSATSSSFEEARQAFTNAQTKLSETSGFVKTLGSLLPSVTDVETGKRVTRVGELLSLVGEQLSQGLAGSQATDDVSPTDRLAWFLTHLEAAMPLLDEASRLSQTVSVDRIPASYREAWLSLSSQLPPVVTSLRDSYSYLSLAHALLGGDTEKRYLVVFQNNMEIRPTGGFMGSFAELDIKDGAVVSLRVPEGGTYDLQGQLTKFVAAPEPLRLLSPRFEFQDTNFFADFPTSAQTMMDYYEHAGGPTVDGVISVNATVLSHLLALTGPVDMPAYNRTITSDNFLIEAQKIVELEYDRTENKPKAFIGDLAEVLLERFQHLNADTFVDYASFLLTQLSQKEIQLYMTDDALQRQVLQSGWGGELLSAPQDYLLIANTNLGGGKTDGVISERVTVDVTLDESGILTNTVTLSRTHHGSTSDLFSGLNNVDYVRFYVPKGSELVDAQGFTPPDSALFEVPSKDWEVDKAWMYATRDASTHPTLATDILEESGKTVFGNWIQTKPGTTSTVTIRYRLPFVVDFSAVQTPTWQDKFVAAFGVPTTHSYSLTLQKQSGVLDRTTAVTLHLPAHTNILWQSTNQPEIRFENTTDHFYGMLFETPRP